MSVRQGKEAGNNDYMSPTDGKLNKKRKPGITWNHGIASTEYEQVQSVVHMRLKNVELATRLETTNHDRL